MSLANGEMMAKCCLIWFVLTLLPLRIWSADSAGSVPIGCNDTFVENASRETQMSIVTGRALVCEGHPAYGATRGTYCLLSLFGLQRLPPNVRIKINWRQGMASDGLWAILTVNPVEWFRGAKQAKPEWIEQWLEYWGRTWGDRVAV